jgi:hypothetical protein
MLTLNSYYVYGEQPQQHHSLICCSTAQQSALAALIKRAGPCILHMRPVQRQLSHRHQQLLRKSAAILHAGTAQQCSAQMPCINLLCVHSLAQRSAPCICVCLCRCSAPAD